jgi:hypothetical protein
MTPLAQVNGAQVFCCPWLDLLNVVPECDLLCVDAPYSAKTHAGHDGGTAATSKVWQRADGSFDNASARRSISYAAWTPEDVHAFVAAWAPRTKGWFVSITDNVLAPAWADALEAQGRYVFAPLPFVHPGRGVRLAGDGPSSWTCWIVVARPRTEPWSSWRTLPGAYVQPKEIGERSPVVGGKTSWLMHRLAEDYAIPRTGLTDPPPLVVDPCCGAGTTGIGAIRAGCRFIGGDVDPAQAQIAAQWIRNPWGPAPGQERAAPGQASLFDSLVCSDKRHKGAA